MIIAFIGQKGGAGKSTLAALTAEELGTRGFSLEIADGDPHQQSLSGFAEACSVTPDAKLVTPANFDELGKSGADFTILDTPGELGEAFFAAACVADLIVVPASIGIFDLRTLRRTISAIQRTKPPRLLVVVTRAQLRERLSRQIIESLHKITAPVAKTIIRERSAFRRSCLKGMGILPASSRRAAAREISALVDEMLETLPKEVAA